MGIADENSYLQPITDELEKKWPDNRTVNIVCHGHSVPSGYFATPFVDMFNSYPHLLHRILKERFPFAVINVIVTAIGGENSISGAERFEKDVLSHNPGLITIDYALNDGNDGLAAARAAHLKMISAAIERNIKLLLLTPSWERSYLENSERWNTVSDHREQIISLAEENNIGLVDSYGLFEEYIKNGGHLNDLLSHINHPNRKGHEMIALALARWFPAR